jgi:hypothetical protein
MRAQRRFACIPLLLGLLVAARAAADGGHIGWCTGVGNKHNAACAGTAGVPVVNGGGTPTTTISPGTQGTPTLPVASVSVPQPVAQPGLAVPTPNAIPTPMPVAVPSRVPQPVAQPGLAVPTPNAIPTPMPVAVPSRVPQPVAQPGLAVPTPNAIPTPMPVAVPSQVPQPVSAPYLVPHQVPRPTPVRQPVKVPTTIVDRPSIPYLTVQTPGGTLSTRPAIITPLPGRQLAHALPVHRASADASRLTCLASGFGWRKFDDGNGNTRRVGLAPVLYTSDMLLHDLPANHPRHAECLIVVDRRLEDQRSTARDESRQVFFTIR